MPATRFVERLNEQIAYEFAASQQYIAVAVYYDALTLPRLAEFFYAQALEERNHAMMMVQYLLDADAEVTIPGVRAPETAFADVVAPVALSLEQEKRVSDQIGALVGVAREEGDFQSEQFMQWFLKEQIEEVASMSDLLTIAERLADRPMDIEDWLAREQPRDEGEDPDGAEGRRRRALSVPGGAAAAGAPGGASAARFSDELRAAAAATWEAQHAHPFVRGIGDGTLPLDRFRHFVRQDYLYLVDYGRLLALACARAPELATMRRFAELTQAILVTEMDLHRAFAAEWGIAADELEAEPATPTTRAYADFLLRTAALGDFAELVAALLPCMWGYAEVGARLAAAQPAGDAAGAADAPAADPAAAPANPYARWIATYADPEFQALAEWCRGLTDELGAAAAPAARARLHAAFAESSRHELAFWDAAWRLKPAAV